ncbi:MAG: hemolysin family protein [Planctomycetota bacterium]
MSYVATAVILIFVLNAGAMFFSVNAITLRVFSRGKLQEAFKAINRENLTEALVENNEKLILTCCLYRILLNALILVVLFSLFAGSQDNGLRFTDYIFVFVISAVLFSIFTLAIPHAWAKYIGEKTLCRVYGLLMFFAWIVAPVLYVLRAHDSLVRRMAGVTETTPQEQQEERKEEFLTDLEQHRRQGAVDEEEQEMIENVLELSETTADEIMTPRTDIVAVEINSDLNSLVESINAAGHTRVPVYENNIDNIIGFVYAKDLLSEIGKNPAQFKLREKLRNAYFVPETKPLRVLLHEFQNQKLHIAVVLDEYGGTAGVVTIEDILEELVGEITDEYEETPPKPIRKVDQNTFIVDARTYVDDLNDEFELNLPEDEDYDTVGGFVFSHMGYIPKTGESFNYENLKFTITSAEARRVKRLRIQKFSQ